MSSPPTTSGSTILDFSPPQNILFQDLSQSQHSIAGYEQSNIFQDISHLAQSDGFTGYIAGYPDQSQHSIAGYEPNTGHSKRIHLSASSVEDADHHNVHSLSATEEASDEEIAQDSEDEMEMRISEGSVYPSAFSFISMNELPPQLHPDSTLSSEIYSDSSTLDYTGDQPITGLNYTGDQPITALNYTGDQPITALNYTSADSLFKEPIREQYYGHLTSTNQSLDTELNSDDLFNDQSADPPIRTLHSGHLTSTNQSQHSMDQQHEIPINLFPEPPIFPTQIDLDLFTEPEANSTMSNTEDSFTPFDLEDKIELEDRFQAEDSNEILFFQPSLSGTTPAPSGILPAAPSLSGILPADQSSPPDFFSATEEELDEISDRTYSAMNDLNISEQVVEDLDEISVEFVRRISGSSHSDSRVLTDGLERTDSFGEFVEDVLKSRSTSSVESFGSFDDGPAEPITGHVTSDSLTTACETCYPDTLSLRSHSPPSPKSVLRNNFVWVKARSQVTKPSYRWDQLKLSSYLLGALGVRKPITLNRLRNTPTPGATPSISRASSVRDMSPVPSLANQSHAPSLLSEPVSAMSPEPFTSSLQEDRSEVSSNGSWDEPRGKLSIPQCCKPLPSVIKMKFNSHRRVNSVPNMKCSDSPSHSPGHSPTCKTPDTRSLTSSPRLKRQTDSCSSQDSTFDQSHAARGLQLLELVDIEAMKNEMQNKVAELSGTLIQEFQYRGDADHSREVKTAFVAALRAAEEMKSKGKLTQKQLDWLPLHNKEHSNVCPSTEILVLLTQVLLALASNTPHLADLIKHYKRLQ